MADEDYAYLNGLSEHPDRAGDTSNFNPAFATPLASALRQANAQGLHLGVMSGFREPGQTGSAYDAGGNSSHTYGLASDISGLDGPNGKITNQWAQIAAANGLHNPYGVGNSAEFNHWQLPTQPLEKTPQLLAQLQAAKASGDMSSVWSAYNGAKAPQPITSAGTTLNTTSPLAGSHSQFITDYANKIGLDPNLALGIAKAEGLNAWSALNPNAASRVDVQGGQPFSFGDFQLNVHPGAMGSKAIAAGVDPRDPSQWQAADRFALDQMKSGGVGPWKGDPVAANYLKTGAAPAVAATDSTTPAQTGVGGAIAALTQGTGTDQKGPSALDSLQKLTNPEASKQQQAQAAALQPLPADPGQQMRLQQINMESQQLLPQLEAKAAQPLTWGSRPFGSNAGLQSAPGTTLNSTGGLYG